MNSSAEEKLLKEKREKARQLLYKKPIVKELNLYAIKDKLFDIQGECEEVRWYTDSEDGEDSLLNALDGDEDEAYEFKMAFADLLLQVQESSLAVYLAMILMREITLELTVWMPGQKTKQRKS